MCPLLLLSTYICLSPYIYTISVNVFLPYNFAFVLASACLAVFTYTVCLLLLSVCQPCSLFLTQPLSVLTFNLRLCLSIFLASCFATVCLYLSCHLIGEILANSKGVMAEGAWLLLPLVPSTSSPLPYSSSLNTALNAPSDPSPVPCPPKHVIIIISLISSSSSHHDALITVMS